MMKRIVLLMALAVALPVFAAAETWSNSFTDSRYAKCSEEKAKADPERTYAGLRPDLRQESGFGILDKDGNYLKFDAKGNAEAMKLLQSTAKKDHLRVSVSGEKQGDVIQVQSLTM